MGLVPVVLRPRLASSVLSSSTLSELELEPEPEPAIFQRTQRVSV